MKRPVIKSLTKKDINHMTRLVIKIHNQKGYKSHDKASDKIFTKKDINHKSKLK